MKLNVIKLNTFLVRLERIFGTRPQIEITYILFNIIHPIQALAQGPN